jgi:glycosyltransferase involved in cell wall biosynthesis
MINVLVPIMQSTHAISKSVMKDARKNILFVVPYNPLLGSKGAQGPKNVSQPLISLLSDAHDVTLIVISDDTSLDEGVLSGAFPSVRRVHVCRPLTGWRRKLKRLYHVLACLPASLADGYSLTLRPLLRQYAPGSDLVHFEYFTLAPSIQFAQTMRPVQLHCHDAYSLYQLRVFEQARGLAEKAKAWVRYTMFRRLEHNLIARADVAMTVSPVDCDYLRAAGLTNVHYLPAAVQERQYEIPAGRSIRPLELLCVVPATYHQFQAEALRDFFRDDFPALQRKFPGKLPVTLFGKSAPRLQAELAPFIQVDAVGFVDDYFSFLAERNWIYFYPQRAGAGLHTKVRDAMAVRLPVVGYAEIMNAFQGKNWTSYISCESPAAVVAALEQLLENPELRQVIGEGGNHLLAERFSPNEVLRTLDGFLIK